MKINAVISKPSLKLNSTDKTAVLSAAIIVLGVMVGTVIYSVTKDGLINDLCDYYLFYVTDFSNKNKPEILSGIILSNIPYLIMMLIFGTSVVGIPGVVALTFTKSMGIGLLVTYIYEAFALKGIEYCLLVLLPGKFIMIFAMILLTQSCYVNSLSIRKCMNNSEDRVVSLHKFALRSFVIVMLFIFSSVVDFLTLKGFSTLFDFT